MPFIEISDPPPANNEFVEWYNILVDQCKKRGFGESLTEKEKDAAVEQKDLDSLRTEILEGRKQYFEPSLLDLTQDNPFSSEDVWPQINDGKGFLVMPGRYTTTGNNVCSMTALGDKVPVLSDHLKDIENVLKTLQHRTYNYRLHLDIDRDRLNTQVEILRGTEENNSHLMEFDETEKRLHDPWLIFYRAVSLTDGAESVAYTIYYRRNTEDWQAYTNPAGVEMGVDKVLVDISRLGAELDYSEAEDWKEDFQIQPVVSVVHKIPFITLKGQIEDDEKNGVAVQGSCRTCCDVETNKYNYLKDSLNTYFSSVRQPLAMSNGAQGIIIGHYIRTYTYAGKEYGQYNCDTRIDGEYSGSGTDEEGRRAEWELCNVIRPSGARVLFSLKGSRAGQPSNNKNYWMSKSGGQYSISFFEDRFVHYFSGKELQSCYIDMKSESIPGAGVIRRKSGNTYHFYVPEFGGVSVEVNTRGVPGRYLFYLSSDMRRARTRQATHDTVAEITTSSALEDAVGFDFSDFYAPGEMPDFGAPESCYIMNFFNEDEVLIGKYIELRRDSGIVTKGFWNREEGTLLPTELSVLERIAETDGSFLEVKSIIKYGLEGRSEAVHRSRKRKLLGSEVVVEEYRHYGTPEELHAIYEYGMDTNSPDYAKLLFSRDFDGKWRKCEYDAAGRQIREITPFMDSEPEETENHHRITAYSYEALRADEEVRENDSRPRTVIQYELGQEVGRSYQLYFAGESWSIIAAAPGAAYDAVGNMTSKNYIYTTGEFTGRQWKNENSDGSSTVMSYRMEGDNLESTQESGYLPGSGIRTVTLADPRGHALSLRSYDIATGLLISGSDYTYDDFGRVLTETTIDGDVTTTEYNCCGPRFITQPDGTVTEYARDTFGRLKFESSAGVTTYHVYDANDNEIKTIIAGKEGGELISLYEYDEDGELVKETDPLGAETVYSSGAGWSQITNALQFTRRTENYYDGSIKALDGTAVVPVHYEYGVEDHERFQKQSRSATEWLKGYTDFLGRSNRTSYSDGFVETTGYDSLGRSFRHENSEGLKQLVIYDSGSGEVKYRVTKRLDGSDEIDWDNDSITGFHSGYYEDNGEIFSFSENGIWIDGVYVVTARSEKRRDGKKSLETSNGQTGSSAVVYEGDGVVKTTTTLFDGVVQIDEFENGLLRHSTSSASGDTEFIYDEFNRQTGSDRIENEVLHSFRVELDGAGNVLVQTEGTGNTTRSSTFTYDLLGQRLSTTTPEGALVAYSYTQLGAIATVSSGDYRQVNEYNLQGRQEKLIIRQNDDTQQETRFEYDNRGRSSRKIYADSNSESWSYRGDGKIAAYVNARGQTLRYSYNRAGELIAIEGAGLTMEYDRNGRIASLTDRSGNRRFQYDAYGKAVWEATESGSISRSYDRRQRLSELRLGGPQYTYICYSAAQNRCIRRITETPDSTTLEFSMGAWEERAGLVYQPLNTTFELDGVVYDDFGRPEAHPHFGEKQEALSPYIIEEVPGGDGNSALYFYGDDGRLQRLVSGDCSLTYAYLEGTGLVRQSIWRQGNHAPFITLDYEYDRYLRLTQIKFNGNPITGYEWSDDDRRTSATLPDASVWNYTYDTLGQLTNATRGTENSMSYDYDGIGNRITATEDGTVTEYAANLLNQYTKAGEEEPAWDADGNMLAWNGWTYSWNEENRLIAAEKEAVRVEADYDYMGRRFEKKVYENGVLVKHQRFAYDEYKLIAVYDILRGNRMEAAFLWQTAGLDVPLTMTRGDETFYYVTDGNKNVLKLLRQDGSEAADYVYAPFGAALRQSGELATENPFRFSSEYHDDETGLVYYNFRYYNPALGRWLKRDVIGEEGGPNVYGFVGNDSINRFDLLGLAGLFFDGTSNLPFDNTNVWLMYKAYVVIKEATARKYFTGVGNDVEYSNPDIAAAHGRDIFNKAEQGISFMKERVAKGDCIVDVVGFSRGAVTAVIFLNKLKKDPELQEVRVRFVGLFDPVPGPFIGHQNLPGDLEVKPYVFYAVDETRAAFRPTVYSSSVANVEFYRGAHSDIGGGYKDRRLANKTLRAMINHGIAAGAPFDRSKLQIPPNGTDPDDKYLNKDTGIHFEFHLWTWYEPRNFSPIF